MSRGFKFSMIVSSFFPLWLSVFLITVNNSYTSENISKSTENVFKSANAVDFLKNIFINFPFITISFLLMMFSIIKKI